MLNDPKRKDALVEQAYREMETFQDRFSSLNVLKNVFDEMKKAQATIEGRRLKQQRAQKRAAAAQKKQATAAKKAAKLAAAAPAAKPARKRKAA